MAEIKSTMEKVMERLAAMDSAAGPDELLADEKKKEGMRLAAAFLRGEEVNLTDGLAGQSEVVRKAQVAGQVQAFLRNIVLPREEAQQKQAERAMQGLLTVGHADAELVAVFGELKTVLDRYLAQRNQIRQQLQDYFSQQLGQLQAKGGMGMKIRPEQHPKYQEEWQRAMGELDNQYGRALVQYKELVQKRLTM
ncbi:MAG: hypothetical protein OEV73_11540 [Desulfobulbaceae bacterium]|nr:hypothetical protein [Desulfobulbaceae bacterium]